MFSLYFKKFLLIAHLRFLRCVQRHTHVDRALSRCISYWKRVCLSHPTTFLQVLQRPYSSYYVLTHTMTSLPILLLLRPCSFYHVLIHPTTSLLILLHPYPHYNYHSPYSYCYVLFHPTTSSLILLRPYLS